MVNRYFLAFLFYLIKKNKIFLECGLVENSSNLKIVGGKEAVPHSWPSIVFIDFYYKYEFKQPNGIVENKTEESTCGGSLIDRYTVLTAAHCFTKKFTVEDVFGKEHEVIVKPNKFHSTFESMYNVYIGMHDVGDLDGKLDGIKVPVYKFKIVFINFFENKPLKELRF